MSVTKFRWSKVYESSEEELVDFLEARAIAASRHDNEPFQALDQAATTAVVTLWCAEGSATVQAAASRLSFQPGDGLRIPADTAYSLTMGMSGCVYYVSTH